MKIAGSQCFHRVRILRIQSRRFGPVCLFQWFPCFARTFYLSVSENSGTPKSSILIGFSIVNHPFCGSPYFWKYPFGRLDFRHPGTFHFGCLTWFRETGSLHHPLGFKDGTLTWRCWIGHVSMFQWTIRSLQAPKVSLKKDEPFLGRSLLTPKKNSWYLLGSIHSHLSPLFGASHQLNSHVPRITEHVWFIIYC